MDIEQGEENEKVKRTRSLFIADLKIYQESLKSSSYE